MTEKPPLSKPSDFVPAPGVLDNTQITFMLVDPSNNVVEFKCYVKPEFSY